MGTDKSILVHRPILKVIPFIVTLIGLFLVGHIQATESPQAEDLTATAIQIPEPYVYDEVIVLFHENIDSVNTKELDIQGSGKKISGKILKKYFAGSKKTFLRVKLQAGQKAETVLSENWNLIDPRILRVEPNYRVYAMSLPSDTYFSYQWGLHNTGQTNGVNDGDIDAPEAWNITTGSSNVVVAVIDSGVNYAHPDLRNQMWTNTDEIPGNGIDDDRNGYVDDYYGYDFSENDSDPNDENGHGTHCAGIIDAQGNNNLGVSGVNWNCRIMPCRFLDASGSGTIADAIEAINYAVDNGAQVLSNSWGGGGYSEALKNAIENARQNNVLFVAAAGNSAADNDILPNYPSSYSVANVIAVAATDHLDKVAYFSSYGRQSVDVAAPGVNILSTVPGGYGWCSGTSMATPFVSGVAALLLAVYPEISIAELKNRIIWTGDPLADLQSKTLTGRRLNAYKALTAESALTLVEPAGSERWVVGFSYDIQWISIGSDSAVCLYLEKEGQIIETIAQNIPDQGSYTWSIPAHLTEASDYTIRIENSQHYDRSQAFTIAEKAYDYYTELFSSSSHPFDLTYKSVLFVPGQSEAYTALTQDISALPVNPAGGRRIRLHDDDAAEIVLSDTFILFEGISYSRFFVGSNGYITFDQADTEYRATLLNHFSKHRISACFLDLNPDAGGQISVKETPDRVAITWDNVPKFNGTAVYTFQLELYYNGKIRMSWLDCRPAAAVIGFSSGDGIAADYLNSNLSDYDTYKPPLLSLEIDGNSTITENSTLQLSCTGYYDDGIIRDITDDQDINWSAVPAGNSISASGTLFVGDVDIFHHVNIIAQVDGVQDNYGVFVKGQDVDDIYVSKCSVATGKTRGQDRISISGTLSLPAETLQQAESIRIKLYSNSNLCLLESTYEINDSVLRNGICSLKYSEPVNSNGRKEVLRIDSRKNIFRFSVKNVNLKGLSCPFYMSIECGAYTGAGAIQENVANGKRDMPIILMDEVDNSLRIDTIKMSAGKTPASVKFTVNGGFSLQNKILNPGDIVLKWNTELYIFPIDLAAVRNNIFVYRNIQTENGILSGKIDMMKNTFTFQVKNTNISTEVSRINVGLVFDTFDESQASDL